MATTPWRYTITGSPPTRGTPVRSAASLYENASGTGPCSRNSSRQCTYTDSPLARETAGQGDAQAWYNLGVMYHNGTGVGNNADEAARLFKLSCDQGFTEAQEAAYVRGKIGVPQNDTKAAAMYQGAAAKGHLEVQHDLAMMYATGTGARITTPRQGG